MVQKWKNTGHAEPTGSTAGADRFVDHTDGINTVATCYYGTTDPSSGMSWGVAEAGTLWLDATNEIDAAGDDTGPVLKRWSVLTSAPTYGWRTLGGRGYVALEPNVNKLALANQSTTAFTDCDVNSDVGDLAISVLLQVEVEDSGTPAAAVYAELRKNGTTTDARSRRVYPQVTDIPNMRQVMVELDDAQTFEYAINASGATTFDLRVDILGYFERA